MRSKQRGGDHGSEPKSAKRKAGSVPGLREKCGHEVSPAALRPGDLVPLPTTGLAIPDFSCGIETMFRNDEGFFVVITCRDRDHQYEVYKELAARNYTVQIYPDRREKRGKAARLKKK